MPKKTSGFNIREKELAAALEITPQELDKIILFFDADPNDEWDLRENDHFIYLNKTLDERLFSEQGAFAIAAYMDTIAKKTLWDRIKEFVTRHKEKIRNAFINRKIQENSSSLTLRNNRHFLSRKDILNILCTSPARLNKAFDDIQKSDNPMIIHEDFDDFEGIRYYSLSGFYRLSERLANELKDKDRRSWCAAVEFVSKRTFKLILDEQSAREKKIEAAMNAAKKRDGSRCQLTGSRRDKHNRINMTVHHIFSKEHYPHLAACRENLITLEQDVHNNFHSWNGGFQQPCTVDDLIRFANELYPDNYEVSLKLNQVKEMLGDNILKAS